MTDPLAIAEALASSHPNMRLSKALARIKHEMRRQAVLDELRAPRPSVAEPAPSTALSRIITNLRKLADKMEQQS